MMGDPERRSGSYSKQHERKGDFPLKLREISVVWGLQSFKRHITNWQSLPSRRLRAEQHWGTIAKPPCLEGDRMRLLHTLPKPECSVRAPLLFSGFWDRERGSWRVFNTKGNCRRIKLDACLRLCTKSAENGLPSEWRVLLTLWNY